MIVNITQEHIDKGKERDHNSCPIALALRELYPQDMVSVGTALAYIEDREFSLSYEARMFIKRFDAGARVEPTLVKLELLNDGN